MNCARITPVNPEDVSRNADENMKLSADDGVATPARLDMSEMETEIRKLIDDLKSPSIDTQREAASTLRLLAKSGVRNRILIPNCGAIGPFVGLLHTTDAQTRENAMAALSYLSIFYKNKKLIADSGGIKPLIHVIKTGNASTRENSVATLFRLSKNEENVIKIGQSGAIQPLVDLLGHGTQICKNHAISALLNLSLHQENKAKIIEAGAVRHLVDLTDPASGMTGEAVAVLANLATVKEGRVAIVQEHGIPALVKVLELGSERSKENATAALLQISANDDKLCVVVMREGAIPPLVALTESGTAKGREKAQALLNCFGSHRQGDAWRR